MKFRTYKKDEGISKLVFLAKEYKRECGVKEDLLTLLDRLHHKIINDRLIIVESKNGDIIGFIMGWNDLCYILPEFRR